MKLPVLTATTFTVKGNKYILTFQDDLSKYGIGVPIHQQDKETLVREFVLRIILKHGTPCLLQTDQGSNFLSEVFESTCELLRIKNIQSPAFHPESQGSLERSHCMLAKYLTHYIKERQGKCYYHMGV